MTLQAGTYRDIDCLVDSSDTDTPVTDVAGDGGDVILSALNKLTGAALQDKLHHRMNPVRCFGKELILTEAFSRSTLGYTGSPTTNSDEITIGYQDMVITGNGSTSVNYYNATLWSTTNLSDPDDATKLHPRLRCRIRFHVPGSTATGGLLVLLFSGGGTSNAVAFNVQGGTANTIKPGTHEIEFIMPSSGGFGTFDPTDVQGLGFRLSNLSTADVDVYVQCVQFWIDYSPAIVTWRMDDGRDEQYRMACEMEEFGWFATLGVIGSVIDTTGHLTLAQVKELDRRGHLIVSHSYGASGIDGDNWGSTTSAQKAAQLLENRRWLIDNGLTRGADMFIVPNGFTRLTADQDDMDMIFDHASVMMNTSPMIRYMRGSGDGNGMEPYSVFANGQNRPWDRRCVHCAAIDNTATTTLLDTIIETGQFGQILLHDDTGVSPSITQANFRALMAAVRVHEVATRCEVMTMEQILAGDRPRGHEATAAGWAAARA